jgi:hypothetical protein
MRPLHLWSTARALAAISAAVLLLSAASAEPVRHVGIYVQPYYEAAREPGGTPRVAVGESYSRGLASNKPEDIVAIRDKIVADPKLVTPMTLMVLAIRLYDVGLRDDAVFWFYAAKDRYLTLEHVIDVIPGGLASVAVAVRDFTKLAGPFINGYAFCDVTKNRRSEQRRSSGSKNPYEAIFMERLTAKAPGDRRAALRRAVAEVTKMAAEERAYLSIPKNVAEMRDTRAKNGMDEKFCWKQ